MFNLQNILSAHSKVKSGTDFPNYIQDLKKLGVLKYHTFVEDGHTDYFGENAFQITSEAKYLPLKIQEKADINLFKIALKAHQEGKTNYPTFCQDCANYGIEKWIVSLDEMNCIYLDKFGNKILIENIPQ